MIRLANVAMAAALALAPMTALAEGEYEPFPNTARETVVGNIPAHDVGSSGVQSTDGTAVAVVAGALERTGGDGHPETANGLPPTFTRGSASYAGVPASAPPLAQVRAAAPGAGYSTHS